MVGKWRVLVEIQNPSKYLLSFFSFVALLHSKGIPLLTITSLNSDYSGTSNIMDTLGTQPFVLCREVVLVILDGAQYTTVCLVCPL